MHLIDLLSNIDNITLTKGNQKSLVKTIRCDSRTVEDGALFVCLAGERADGHDFIASACEAGAAAVLTDGREVAVPDGIAVMEAQNTADAYARLCARFWPARPGMLVGVTGTNGKTSVCEYLRQIWHRATWPAATIGTLGIFNPANMLKDTIASLTTPQTEILFSNLHSLAEAGVNHTAFEASSHGLAQGRIAGLSVNVAVFTNLSRDHLDWHKDMEHYFAAKARLFENNLMDGGTAIVNIDDDFGRELASRIADRNVVLWTVGTSKEATFHIDEISTQPFGLDLSLSHETNTLRCPLALSGRFQAVNAVMAAVTAYASGLPLRDCFGCLPDLKPVRGRMQPVYGHPTGARIVIDYAHTPDALGVALNALRAETPGKLLVVFGCGGDRDKGKRAQMGHIAAEMADDVIITDDNPRNEDPVFIRNEIQIGCPKARIISPRDDAIRYAISVLSGTDSLLIAGKGHETVQMIGTETLPFDDAAVARNMIVALEKDASC